MSSSRFFADYRAALRGHIERIPEAYFEAAAALLDGARRQRRQIYAFGNGASAVLAQHLACDLNKNTRTGEGGLDPRFRVIPLSADMASLTAWANDASYEEVFVGQLRGFLEPGDVVVGISASGNSPNVVRAMEYGRAHGARTLAFPCFADGKVAAIAEVAWTVPDKHWGRVEDLHHIFMHLLAYHFQKQGRPAERVAAHGALRAASRAPRR